MNDKQKDAASIIESSFSPQKAQRELFKIGVRRCYSCKEIKDLADFGKHSEGSYRRCCKECGSSISRRNWKLKRENQTLEEAIQYKFYQARYRSKGGQKNREFDLNVEDVKKQWEKQEGLCAYSGTPMDIKANSPNHFSIDRVDSSQGYHRDNIVLCINVINLMKRDLSTEEFVDRCISVVGHWNSRPY
jgi:hypothetical protein